MISKMPLTISAALNRQCGVYLASETLQCKITLQCNDFKGSAVKYVYKLSVGVQAGCRAVKLLKIPFRLLSSTDYTDEISAAANIRKTQIFRVADEQRGEICSIKMERKIFKLGDDVSAILEFENSNFKCFEFSAFLQTVEEINDQKKKNEVTYCEKTEFCAFYKSCQIDLQIPTRAPPSFFTDFINLKWRLRFEFSVAENPIDDKICHFDPKMMNKDKVKRLVWDLPLKIFPCNPIHVDTERAKDFVLYLQ
uniref:Uncharacterized protein n=1 Tax=Romanomermis culicivorax TaxID=13658 RepID=A0A915HX06_ROMCU